MQSRPLGGDQKFGAMIAPGGLDMLIFLVDPLTAVPHDADIEALIRVSTFCDIPYACNPATADRIVGFLRRV